MKTFRAWYDRVLEVIGAALMAGLTVILVTHSISEAVLLSDRVVVLSARPGRVLRDLDVPFSRPRTDDIRYSPQFVDFARSLRASITE